MSFKFFYQIIGSNGNASPEIVALKSQETVVIDINNFFNILFFILYSPIQNVQCYPTFPSINFTFSGFKTFATVHNFIHPCAWAWICHSWNKNKNDNKPVEAVTVFAPSSLNHMLQSCPLSLSFFPLAGNWKEPHICWHCVELFTMRATTCFSRFLELCVSSTFTSTISHCCSVESKHFSTSMLRFQCYAACANWCIFTYLCMTLCIPNIFRFSCLSFHSCGTLLWA